MTLDVDSPELCQDICQVSETNISVFLAAKAVFFQADPACVAITWTQESFPLYPLRFLIVITLLVKKTIPKTACFKQGIGF